MVYLVPGFSTVLCFLLMISLLKMVSKCGAKVLCSVSQCKKAVMCLMEKICELHNPCSDMSYKAVGHEFNVNESTTYDTGVFAQKHT